MRNSKIEKKRKRYRRVVSGLLVFVLLFSMSFAHVSATETGEGDSAETETVEKPDGGGTSGANGGLPSGTGAPESSGTESASGEPGSSGAEESFTEIISWSWPEEQDLIFWSDENGRWEISLPGASQDNPATPEALEEMLPHAIRAETEAGTEEAGIAWDFSTFPEKAYEGEEEIQASLSEGYSLGADAKELKVAVILGGADTFAISDHTVEGLTPEGTVVNLFDYWLTAQDDPDNTFGTDGSHYWIGINYYHQLKFKYGGMPNGGINKGTSLAEVTPGIVENVLENGYPVIAEGNLKGGYDTAGQTTVRESLDYLFDPSVNHDYKASYPETDGLFQIDNEGYFYYDSQKNFASYDEASGDFILYDTWGIRHTETPALAEKYGQFFPFNTGEEIFDEVDGELKTKPELDATLAAHNEILNHYFGLTMSTSFVQKNGGTNNGKTVTYEFSGDDDVWVFIDDVLVGDVGGMHAACSLKIDFQTGEVFINDTKEQTIKDAFERAGEYTSSQFSGETFSDDTVHTLKFFYLERGNGLSNLKLKFNLITTPATEIAKVDDNGDPLAGASFFLYATGENYQVAEGASPVWSGTTDDEGKLLLLKGNGLAYTMEELRDISEHFVLREESAPPGYRKSGDMHLYFGGSRDAPVLLSENHFTNGAYADAMMAVAIRADDAQLDSSSGVIDVENGKLGSGRFFAVIMKKENGDWYPVTGNSIDGWTVSTGNEMSDIIAAARGTPYEFFLDGSGNYQVQTGILPGQISSYDVAGAEDPGYEVQCYYTTADSLADAVASNTYPLTDAGITQKLSTQMSISNVRNRLIVQKVDEEGTPVNGAAFSLYKEEDVVRSDDGSLSIKAGAQAL